MAEIIIEPSTIGFVTQNGGLYSRDTENNLKSGRDGSFFRAFAQFLYSELSLLDPNPIKIELEFNLSEKAGIPLDDDGMSIVLIITGEPDGVLSSSDEGVFSAIGTGVQFTTIPYNTSTGTKRIDLGETGLQVLQDSLDVEFDFPIGFKIIQERNGIFWTIDREDDVKLIITYESEPPPGDPIPEDPPPEDPGSEPDVIYAENDINLEEGISHHRGTFLKLANSNIQASQTEWNFVINDNPFYIKTPNTTSPNVLNSGIDFIDIWIPPFTKFSVRARQLVNEEFGEWTEYVSITTNGMFNSYERYQQLNMNTITF